jgi:hypothetical protein
MKTSLRPRRSFLAALALCTVSASSLFAAEPALDRLVPADTALVVALRDIPALNARSSDSSFGRAWADPEIARFFAPLRQHPKLVEFLSRVQAETGLTLEEMSALPTGDAMFALPKLNFEDPSAPSLLFAIEVGENQARIAELLAAGSKKPEISVTREDYNGVELAVFSTPAEDPAAEPVVRSVSALHQGRWFIGSDRSAVTNALDALAAGGLASPLAESPDYVRLLDRARGKVEALALFNFRATYPALLASVEAQRDPAAPPNMFGIEPATVMKALGLDAIEGISAIASHRDETDYFTMAFNYSENRGLVRLLAYKDGPVAKPDWMPASWFNVSSQNFSVADFYAELEVLLDRVSPLLAGMAQGQVKTFERQLGVDLKRDLFGSLGTSFVSGFAEPAGASGDKATPYDELDQFIGVSLADAVSFQRTVDAIKGAFLPPGDASPLQSREYLGRTIHSFTPPMPGAKGFSYSISDGWLFVGIGSAGMIESAIQLQAAPNPDLAFWRRADVRAATDSAPAGAVSLQYTELPPLFASLASFFVKLQEDNADETERFVDASALPSRELLARYFKHASVYSVRTSEGLIIESEGPSK